MVAISVRIFADYSTGTFAPAALPQLTIAGIASISRFAGASKARPI